MAPNSHFCGDGGRQSMMSVPSLVLIPADNPNDIKVLCNGKKLSDFVRKPPPVPAISVIPPSSNTYVENKNVTPFVIRRSPLKQVPSSKAEEVGPTQSGGICKLLNFNQISISDESEGSIRTPTTPEVKQAVDDIVSALTNRYKNKKVEEDEDYSISGRDKNDEDDDEDYILNTSRNNKKVFFSSSKYANMIDDANVCDDVFDEVNLTSPPDSTASSKVNYGSNSSEIDSNNNSVKKSNTFYNVTGEDWPPVDLTPEQEQEQFKIFCDNKFRESGGVTPVIVGMIPKSLPGGPTFRMPGVSAQYSCTGGSMALSRTVGTALCSPAAVHPVNSRIATEEPKNDFEGFHNNCVSEQDKCEIDESETNQLCMKNITQESNSSGEILSLKVNLYNKRPRNSSSFVTPPTQTWHSLVLKQNVPTASPSQLCMQMDSSKTVPLWTTPAVIKGPHTQVLPCNSTLDNCQDTYLDYPYHTKDIGAYNAPSLWSTPAILNTDSSQQVILRTPAVQGGVYSSFTQGSHYSSITKRRNYSPFHNQQLEKQEKEINEDSSTVPLSYMGVITNIFKGIFGGLDKVDIPVIYPHYEVANGVPTVETEKKND